MPNQKPNILVFLPDQWRPDFLGFAGKAPVRTPTVDRLARTGAVFTRATTPSPVCAPARACLASGMSYRRNPVANNGVDYPLDRPTVYARLRDAGYQVGSVGKLDLHKDTLDWGLDGKRCLEEWGFTHGLDSEGKLDAMRSYLENDRKPCGPYMRHLAEQGLAGLHADDFRTRHQWLGVEPTKLPDESYSDNWIGANGLDVLRSFHSDRPWFLVANFTGPHNPQDVTASMREWYRDVAFPPAAANTTVDPGLMQEVRRNYAAMCENIDRWLARTLDLVAERGETERTVVFFASDHGEMLGDLDKWGKSTWYQPSVGIPLVVSGRGVAQGTHDALVQLQDLAPTFLEYAGADALPDSDARSLFPLLEGRLPAPSFRDVALCGLNEWDCAWDGRWKLVKKADELIALFDHDNDPTEQHNLFAAGDLSPEAQAAVDRLR